ncbi:hypothetical protein J40TS1_45120 [Paenibacillus montaniterrae]|uniref:Lipoprotein n=1 Tax=Paenibacillus montaniterrae TaxID=429341 RepID=A0A919YSG4_9BACL|nr:hypothetical protein [Paenibacillus montaniterrae]GIP18870.1 hypothetical protein J40TS1_45120 [Paenibacillus montaniterrae]
MRRFKLKLAVSIFFIIASLLLGCSRNNTLLYTGSGDNWDIKYTVTMFSDKNNDNYGIYTLTYTGTEKVTGSVSYEITSDFLNESGILPLNNGVIKSRTYDKYLETENVITFTIEWNDHQETILAKKN